MALLRNEYMIHKTFLSRLYESSDNWVLKAFKFSFYLDFLAPSRYLASNTWAPTLAPFVAVLYWLLLRSPEASGYVKCFIFYHFVLLVEGSCIYLYVKFFPASRATLDTFLYGPDMTKAFLGNPGSQSIKTLARAGLATLGASGIWYGEGVAATSEVTNEILQHQRLNPTAEPVSLSDFQARIDQAKTAYPLHATANLVDVSITMKKTGSAGFAASGIHK